MAPMDVAAIVYAIEQVESGGRWWVQNGGCVGVMQVNPRWSVLTRAQLLDPNANRAEGERLLKVWLKQSGGNLRRALAAYNCGNNGLKGKCGGGYAAHVLSKVAEYRTWMLWGMP